MYLQSLYQRYKKHVTFFLQINLLEDTGSSVEIGWQQMICLIAIILFIFLPIGDFLTALYQYHLQLPDNTGLRRK